MNKITQFIRNVANQLFVKGFGVPLLNSAGTEEYNEWHTQWMCAIKLKGRQYILPQGSIGRQFGDMLQHNNTVTRITKQESSLY